MTRLAPFLIALLALVLVPATASAAPGGETRTGTSPAGEVKAELTYDKVGDFEFRDVRIKVTRAGAVLHDALVPAPCDECPVIPQGLGDSEVPALAVRDLDGNGEPEVLVDLYTGGAHCCSYTQIYSLDGNTPAYRRTKGSWGDYGYELRDLDKDGRPEFVSADFRFAAAFTAYAASGAPPMIFVFGNRKLKNVTRRFPSRIKSNLKQYRRLYKEIRNDPDVPDVRGFLAAYTADKLLLGQRSTAFDLVYAAYRRGELRPLEGDTSPSGKRYIAQLRKFLRKWGYL
ncbi:MAG TPA: hypothetical protein VHF45_12060 [Thermoleophilaceae bacterium]|nr:hypothetical protein [Thermoleophilaceae bacterium]